MSETTPHIPVLLTLGMSGYRFSTFFLFDLVGIVLWALAFVSIGFLFGHQTIDIIWIVKIK